MKVLAHRANGYGYPENTSPAFEAAFCATDNDGVELDVHLTKDGQVIVHHDDTLGRLFRGDEFFEALEYEEILKRECLLEDFQSLRIPLLSEGLVLLRESEKVMNIEVKVSERADALSLIEKTLALVSEFGVEEQVYFSSFDVDCIERLLEIKKEKDWLRVNLLLEHGDRKEKGLVEFLKFNPLDGLHLSIESWRGFSQTERSQLLEARPIRLWTVNDLDDAVLALARGVDTVMTDYASEIYGKVKNG